MKIEEQYLQLNRDKKKTLIFHLGHSAGLYSEINNMVFAIIYCIQNNICFKLYSADANFREKDGWDDYFIPFCKEVRFRPLHYINGRTTTPTLGIKTKIYIPIFRFLCKNTFLTQDLWDEIRCIDKTFMPIRILDVNINSFQEATKRIIHMIYRFNEQTRKKVDLLKESISIEGEYLGLHIRGGDKITECEIINVERYMDLANSLSTIHQIFVSTDDYRFFEELCKKYPDYKFFTISNSASKGYLQSNFVNSTPTDRRNSMINMFASMELLLESQHVICTYSSNIGMFLGMMMEDRAHGVDFSEWRIW